MQLFKVSLLMSIFCLLLMSVAPAEMSISISNLQDGDILTPCVDFDVLFDVNADGKTISDILLYSNGSLKARVRREPWQYTWRNMVGGVYTIQALLRAEDGTEAWSDPITIRSGYISRGEKAFNGSFNCGTSMSPWSMNVNSTDGGAATGEVIEEVYFDDIGYLYVEIANRGSADWHIQVHQNIPVDSAHVYAISFFADADDEKLIRFTMQENQDPWVIQFSQDVTIDGADLYGPYEFIAARTDPTNFMRFNLGTDTTPVYLDNIQVIDQSMSSVKATEFDFSGAVKAYELFAAYPNPFNMNTTISFSLSQKDKIDLTLYDMHGRLIRTLASGLKDAGHHHIRWDGRDESFNVVPSGIYFYRLSIAADSRSPIHLTKKIVLVK
ncbi:carbohydrate binding domain-containing protein [candidate division KSB1 bacterium]|nr:carbohydrate binding domain-containing protein [candidate division KSB1 bacterium]